MHEVQCLVLTGGMQHLHQFAGKRLARVLQGIVTCPQLQNVAQQEDGISRRVLHIVRKGLPGGIVVLQMQIGHKIDGLPCGWRSKLRQQLAWGWDGR